MGRKHLAVLALLAVLAAAGCGGGTSGRDGSAGSGGSGGAGGAGGAGGSGGSGDAGLCEGTTRGTCAGALSCLCCPIGGPLERCICSTPCSSDTECTDPARPHCEHAPGVSGFCSPVGFQCCWGCQ